MKAIKKNSYYYFTVYASMYETMHQVELPKNSKGSYIMQPKDGFQIKNIVNYLEDQVPEESLEIVFRDFIKAAYTFGDKWERAHLTPGLLWVRREQTVKKISRLLALNS